MSITTDAHTEVTSDIFRSQCGTSEGDSIMDATLDRMHSCTSGLMCHICSDIYNTFLGII